MCPRTDQHAYTRERCSLPMTQAPPDRATNQTGLDPQQIDPWWQLIQNALAQQRWLEAEGALRRLLNDKPDNCDLLDLLGYALLMQGAFATCEATLRAALAYGSRNFWTPHKLGDALRGQQRMAEAIAAYEQALEWGSDSPLTTRNLLQVLDGIDAAQAVAHLNRCAGASSASALNWQQRPPWLQGACEAALLSTGMELAHWLQSHGCPDPAVRRLALQDAVLHLDLATALRLADGPLKQRLIGFLS